MVKLSFYSVEFMDPLHCKNYMVVLTQTCLSQLLDLYAFMHAYKYVHPCMWIHAIVRDMIIVMGRNHSGMYAIV